MTSRDAITESLMLRIADAYLDLWSAEVMVGNSVGDERHEDCEDRLDVLCAGLSVRDINTAYEVAESLRNI